MIVYHKNNEIDREQWDNCIKNSPEARPYGYSWFLDIMASGWEALVDDDYDSVFPLPSYTRFGIRFVETPAFIQQLGAYSPDKPGEASLSEFLQYMPEAYRHIDLCVSQKVTIEGYRITEKLNFELDLAKSYSKLSGSFSPHCGRILDSLQKKKTEISFDITPDQLIDLHIRNSGKIVPAIRLNEFQKLKNLMNFCLKNKKGRIIGVRSGRRKIIFGLFLVETQGRKTILFMVNTPEGVSKKAGYQVVDHLINEHASSKMILDFGRSATPVADSFMESFGSYPIPYYRIYQNRLFWPVRMLK
jgi:hypothetical protein